MENNTSTANVHNSSLQTVQFTLLLITEIFAIISTLFLLCYISFHWQTMMNKTLHNHATFLVIIVSFLYLVCDLPLTIHLYQLNSSTPQAISFCLWWSWIDNSLLCISLLLATTASIQRYFLLFKSHLLRGHRSRWFIHYFPLIVSIVYPSLFYCAVIIFYPCGPSNENDDLYCLYPCYVDNPFLFNFDWILHSAVPLMIVISAHAALFMWMIHTMWNFDHREIILWKRQKRLLRQLLAFSSLYVIVWTPAIIVSVVDAISKDKSDDHQSITIYLNYISNFICPLQPVIWLLLLPEPIQFIKTNVRRWLAQSTVEPVVTIRP